LYWSLQTIMKRLLLTMIHSRADRCIDLNDHGRSRGGMSPVGGVSRLAVVVTVAKGYDLGPAEFEQLAAGLLHCMHGCG
jgi:hypothetical protein